MKKSYKRNSHIISELHLIYIYPNNDRHPVPKTFIPSSARALKKVRQPWTKIPRFLHK